MDAVAWSGSRGAIRGGFLHRLASIAAVVYTPASEFGETAERRLEKQKPQVSIFEEPVRQQEAFHPPTPTVEPNGVVD